MSRVHHGRCAIISTHAQCQAGSCKCPGITLDFPINSTHAQCLAGSCQCPGSSLDSATNSTHAQCPPGSRRCPGSIMGGVQLFQRMRNAHLDHAEVQGPSGECAIIPTHAQCPPGSLRCPGPSWERGFSPLPSFSTAISEHRTGSTEKEEEKNRFMINISLLCVSFSRHWKVLVEEHELCWQKHYVHKWLDLVIK
jgi:hypothetical protein